MGDNFMKKKLKVKKKKVTESWMYDFDSAYVSMYIQIHMYVIALH